MRASPDSPTIFAGPSKGAICDICGQGIPAGAVEYEVEFEALTLRVDRSCFSMWQSEVAKS